MQTYFSQIKEYRLSGFRSMLYGHVVTLMIADWSDSRGREEMVI